MLLCAAAVFAVGLGSILIPLPEGTLDKEKIQSLSITDYRGVLLRESLNDEAGRGRWAALADIVPTLQQATIAVEDKRFFGHPGVDPIAIARSLAVNIRSGSFASGGSTLTQQLVRNIRPHSRTLAAKFLEAWQALRLERVLSKKEILEQYLNRVSYGNNLRGVEAAARFYFHKHADGLSLAESAFLAGLPNAPTLFDPYTHRTAAEARQKLVLRRMLEQGMIDSADFDRAAAQPLQLQSRTSVFRAPHVCDMIVKQYAPMNAATVTTTIDEALQEQITSIVGTHLRRLVKKNVTNAAVIVIDNTSGAIRVLIGSNDYFNEHTSGQVNGVLALRQPGSSIKPLMYTLAFERGHTPADIIADIPTAIPDVRGDYVPENYDRTFHGPVSIRTALACSYNVPAVRVLESIGTEAFLQTLRSLGITSLTETAEYYGYGLTLGNAEVSLLELANAYRALANGGEWRPAFLVAEAKTSDGAIVTIPDVRAARRIYSSEAAFLTTDILSDPDARRPAFGYAFRFPFACAVKTGTTKDYKDNWTLGYTTRYTVGVWVGNFNGSPMQGVSGVTGAGQVFTDVMMLLHSAPFGTLPDKFIVPPGVEQRTICPRSGNSPTSACPYHSTEWAMIGDSHAAGSCTVHRRYAVPDERGVLSERVFEIFSPEYAAWQQSAGIPLPPPDAVPAVRDGHPAGARAAFEGAPRLVIGSPNNGDHFKLDPALRSEYQTITIRGFSPPQAEDVRLAIDRSEGVPFSAGGVVWKLQKGVHHFQLICMLHAQRITSTPVTITVE
jgi:penicillin-binding protein 1C